MRPRLLFVSCIALLLARGTPSDDGDSSAAEAGGGATLTTLSVCLARGLNPRALRCSRCAALRSELGLAEDSPRGASFTADCSDCCRADHLDAPASYDAARLLPASPVAGMGMGGFLQGMGAPPSFGGVSDFIEKFAANISALEVLDAAPPSLQLAEPMLELRRRGALPAPLIAIGAWKSEVIAEFLKLQLRKA